MTDQDLLLNKAQENIKAARILLREDMPNIAASRAYYALFYIAETLLLSRELTYSSHSAVIAAYGKEFSRSEKLDRKYHHYLIVSMDTRQIGDYAITENVEPIKAERMIEWAEEFYAAAVEYLKNNPQSSQTP